MVQPVVAHLVAHDGADLGQRRAVQQVVVERDARRAAEPRDVCADALGLFRGVEPEHVIDRDPGIPREREDRVPHFAGRQRLVVVEERLDDHRLHVNTNRIIKAVTPVAHQTQRSRTRRTSV